MDRLELERRASRSEREVEKKGRSTDAQAVGILHEADTALLAEVATNRA